MQDHGSRHNHETRKNNEGGDVVMNNFLIESNLESAIILNIFYKKKNIT